MIPEKLSLHGSNDCRNILLTVGTDQIYVWVMQTGQSFLHSNVPEVKGHWNRINVPQDIQMPPAAECRELCVEAVFFSHQVTKVWWLECLLCESLNDERDFKIDTLIYFHFLWFIFIFLILCWRFDVSREWNLICNYDIRAFRYNYDHFWQMCSSFNFLFIHTGTDDALQ